MPALSPIVQGRVTTHDRMMLRNSFQLTAPERLSLTHPTATTEPTCIKNVTKKKKNF